MSQCPLYTSQYLVIFEEVKVIYDLWMHTYRLSILLRQAGYRLCSYIGIFLYLSSSCAPLRCPS